MPEPLLHINGNLFLFGGPMKHHSLMIMLMVAVLSACTSPEDQVESRAGETSSAQPAALNEQQFQYQKCDRGRGPDCVIDGDTFYIGYDKIRIADINTPETYRPECEYESQLGAKATNRMIALLNDGPFVLVAIDRDRDRYGSPAIL